MDFLRFSLHLINFLAWPVVALVYPICASIRAIESGSKYHMRKLVIYWTIFSFISLFQHLFDKLIQWVPLWPHIKLITICWLVIPKFNSACYLYQILIHPCFLVKWHDSISQFNNSSYVYLRLFCLWLSVNLRTVTDWFNKPMEDQSLKNESFLAVVERYLEENGSDALEKLIANKYKDYSSNHHAGEIKPTDTSDEAGRLTPIQTDCEGSGPVWEDIKVMEHMAKHEAAEAKQVKSVKETTGVQVKEMVVPADAEEIKLPEATSSKVCQLIATSEQNLNGRKHKEKCEGLKTSKQLSNSDGSSPVTTKSNQLNLEQVKYAAAAQSEHSANEAAEPKKVKSVKEIPIQIEKRTGVQIKETAFPADAKEIKPPETNSVKKAQKGWICEVCQVTTTSEHDLKCHLSGRRHKEIPIQIEKRTGVQIKETAFPADAKEIKLLETNSVKKVQQKWICEACLVTSTSEYDLKCHLSGRRHKKKCEELKTTAKTERNPAFTSNMPDKLKHKQVKDAVAAQKKNSTNEKPKEKIQHERQTQVKDAGGAIYNSKLWCSLCDIRCPGEIAMAAHLNGKKHLAKLKERI